MRQTQARAVGGCPFSTQWGNVRRMHEEPSSESPATGAFNYDAAAHEPKWQAAWAQAKVDACPPEGEGTPYYVLEMFI